MNRSAQDMLLLLFGVAMLRLGVTDAHLRFVRPAMQPLIVAAAVVLLAVATPGLLQQLWAADAPEGGRRIVAPGATDPGPRVGHGHAHGAPRTAWLLGLPLLVLLLVAPPPLGADAVGRSRSTAPPPVASGYRFPALPAPRDGAVDLSLTAYAGRALGAPETLDGVPVRLLGFAVPDEQGWVLARVTLSCCAADGRPVTVRMAGKAATPVPAADTWFEVVGVRSTGVDAGTLTVTARRPVPAPASPYQSR